MDLVPILSIVLPLLGLMYATFIGSRSIFEWWREKKERKKLLHTPSQIETPSKSVRPSFPQSRSISISQAGVEPGSDSKDLSSGRKRILTLEQDAILKTVLTNRLKQDLDDLDIYDDKQILKAIKLLCRDPTLSERNIATRIELVGQIPPDDLGSDGFLSVKSETNLKEGSTIEVAITPNIVGATSIFYYLRKSGLPLSLDCTAKHGSDIVRRIRRKDISPQVIVGGDGMLAELDNGGLRSMYEPWAILHYTYVGIVMPVPARDGKEEKVEPLSGNLRYSKHTFNGISLGYRRLFSFSKLSKRRAEHQQEPDRALERLQKEPDPDDRHLVYMLQAETAAEAGLGKLIVTPNEMPEMMKNPVIILCKRSFIKSKKSKYLNAKIRQAWKVLRINAHERTDTVNYMLADPDFYAAVAIISGLDRISPNDPAPL